jgi:hypothetical protein
VISGFRRGVKDVFALLGYCAAFIIGYRRFGTGYRSHPHGSSLILEDGTDTLSQNVGNYQSTLRNIPEEQRRQEYIDLASWGDGKSNDRKNDMFSFISNRVKWKEVFGSDLSYYSDVCVKGLGSVTECIRIDGLRIRIST